jgi:hypothetical protein
MSDIPTELEDKLIVLCAGFCHAHGIPISELQRFVGELLMLIGQINETKIKRKEGAG